MESCAPMIGLYWFPVRSNSIRNLPCSAVDPPIGAQDSNQLSENWHPGNKESGNEQKGELIFSENFIFDTCNPEIASF
jgi:hypothetical protein